jgi:hypothetical protein
MLKYGGFVLGNEGEKGCVVVRLEYEIEENRRYILAYIFFLISIIFYFLLKLL